MPAIYAILDVAADDIVQNVLSISRHPAPMVRMFTDLLENKQGPIGQHPEDYALVRLGYINDEHELTTDYSVVITGKQWLTAQQHNKAPVIEPTPELINNLTRDLHNDNQSAQRRALEARR